MEDANTTCSMQQLDNLLHVDRGNTNKIKPAVQAINTGNILYPQDPRADAVVHSKQKKLPYFTLCSFVLFISTFRHPVFNYPFIIIIINLFILFYFIWKVKSAVVLFITLYWLQVDFRAKCKLNLY